MREKLESILGTIEDRHECKSDIWIVKPKNKRWQLCVNFTKTVTVINVVCCPYYGVRLSEVA